MSNFALGRFVRMLILFVAGFIVAYYGLVEARILMTEEQHKGISFIAGLIVAIIGKRHT